MSERDERQAFRDWAWAGEPGKPAIGLETPSEAAWRAWKAGRAAIREAQAAQIAALTIAVETEIGSRDFALAEVTRLAGERDAAEAEATKLREALTPFAKLADEADTMQASMETVGSGFPVGLTRLIDICRTARAALQGEKP